VALLDWELSTLGHPMVDVASLCAAYRTPYNGGEGSFGGLMGLDFEEVRSRERPAAASRRRGD